MLILVVLLYIYIGFIIIYNYYEITIFLIAIFIKIIQVFFIGEVFMKKYLILFSLCILLIFTIFYNYPSKNNIIGNKHYEFSNLTNTKTIKAAIIPSHYSISKKNLNINELLLDDHDMKFYLNSIFVNNYDSQRVVIKFVCKTKWHFTKGIYLSVSEIIKNNNSFSYSNAPFDFKITDENNKPIPYLQFGIGANDDSVEIILNKDVFTNSKIINIEINGLNTISYTRKSLF